jgi:hypothetical protein
MKFTLSLNPSPGDQNGGYTFFSLPLPRGSFYGPLEAREEGGKEPIELWPLAHWPDGSVRMVQGLLLPSGRSKRLEVTPTVEKGVPAPSNDTSFSFGHHQLDRCETTGLYALSYEGRRYFDPGAFAQTFLSEEGERVVCTPERPAQIVVRRRNWMRLETFVSGQTADGRTGFRFRLQWDLFDRVPGCVLAVMAIHDRPGAPVLNLGAIRTEIGMGTGEVLHGAHQRRCGFEYTGNRAVETRERLDIRVSGEIFAPQVENFEALGDHEVYPRHLSPPPREVSPFFWLTGDHRRLVMEVENFSLLRPKGVALEEDRAAVDMWPQWAGPVAWPQGRRRQIRLALAIESDTASPDPKRLQSLTAALLDTHRAQLPAEAYRQAKFFDLPWLPPCRPDRNPRIEGWASQISILKTPPEFFNFGDTIDSHYTRTYHPLGRVPLKPGVEGAVPPGLAVTSGRNAMAAGAMDDRDPVFVNNEYDVLHCLASEHLRSGNFVLFRQLCWFARHTIEVDFFCHHDAENLHRAQGAHSVGHTSGGAYPSHFWTQGLVQYYFLTGDADALEIIRALADKTIWYFEHPLLGRLGTGINREMGWAVLTLVSSYEATLQSEYLAYARKLIDSVLVEPLPADLPLLNFGHTSLLLGCKAYLEATRHAPKSAPVKDWFLRVMRLALHSAWHAPGGAVPAEVRSKLSYDYDRMDQGTTAEERPRAGILHGYAALACLAYAWRLTGERTFLEGGLRTVRAFFDDTPGYFRFFRTQIPEGKSFAWAYRTMMEFFQALDECDLLREFELR